MGGIGGSGLSCKLPVEGEDERGRTGIDAGAGAGTGVGTGVGTAKGFEGCCELRLTASFLGDAGEDELRVEMRKKHVRCQAWGE